MDALLGFAGNFDANEPWGEILPYVMKLYQVANPTFAIPASLKAVGHLAKVPCFGERPPLLVNVGIRKLPFQFWIISHLQRRAGNYNPEITRFTFGQMSARES